MGGWSDGAPRNGVVGRRPGGVCGWSDGRTPLDNICSQYFLSLHRTAVSLPGSAEGYVVGRVLARVGGRTRVQHACSSKISRRCAPRACHGHDVVGRVPARVGGRTRVQHACLSKISRRCAPRARRGRVRPGQGGWVVGRGAAQPGWVGGRTGRVPQVPGPPGQMDRAQRVCMYVCMYY